MALDDQEIRDLITSTIQAEFRPIKTKLDSIQKTMDLMKADLDEDRVDFAKMITSFSTVETLGRQMVEMYSSLSSRLLRTVGDKAEEMIESTAHETGEAIGSLVEPAMHKAARKIAKDNMPPVTKKTKRPWWKFWGR